MPEHSSTSSDAPTDAVSVGGQARPGTPGRAADTRNSNDLAGDIGRRLAEHRTRRGLRAAELARQVGVTPGLISQIERGQSRPSVSTLFALAQVLEMPVDAFFRESPRALLDRGQQAGSGSPEPAGNGADEASGRYLVRKQNRAVIDIEGGVRWERLTRSTMDHLDFFELIYQPGAQSHPRQFTHPGTEMVLVTRGSLEITIGFESYRLGPGDSIDFPSSMPHRYVNPGDEILHAVTVILYDCPGHPGGDPHRVP